MAAFDKLARAAARKKGRTERGSAARTAPASGHVDERLPFSEVYREYYPRVVKYVLSRTQRPSVAEDIAQETMLAAFRNYASFDSSKGKLSTWIFFIASNRLKNYYRSHAGDRNDSLEAKEGFDVASDEPAVGSALELQEIQRVLRGELAGLDERDRAIVEGFFFGGKTNVQLADELGMTATNVGVAKKRALDKLRKRMVEQGFEY